MNAMSDEVSPTNEQVALLMARVFALVQACPTGHVTTYGAIGKALGYPRGARMVGWIMNEAHKGVQAQRVVSSKGELTGSWAFGQRGRMRQLLEAEGVIVSDEERVDMKRYSWDPNSDLTEAERTRILGSASTESITVSPRLLHLMRSDPASPLRVAPST
jgi:methylated-DNA-protein-cysteine methyltransferase-like protein